MLTAALCAWSCRSSETLTRTEEHRRTDEAETTKEVVRVYDTLRVRDTLEVRKRGDTVYVDRRRSEERHIGAEKASEREHETATVTQTNTEKKERPAAGQRRGQSYTYALGFVTGLLLMITVKLLLRKYGITKRKN